MKFGWVRDLPDLRDWRPDKPEVAAALRLTGASQRSGAGAVTLAATAPPIFDQDDLGSCTANAVLRLYGHDELRRTGNYTPLSRLFLYKATRDVLGWAGDCGATIRGTMKTLVLLGCPPEQHWPYRVSQFDREPPYWVAGMANAFQALRYVRLKSLTEIKAYLNAGFPVAFGFSCYPSIDGVGPSGIIPFPKAGERLAGGHAIVAVGYDNGKQAIRVANSWGTAWGDKGCGWLPYQYFEAGLCDDFWVLLWAEHPELKDFK